MSNDLISRSALIETINKISFYSVHNGEFIEGAGLKDVAYYRERDIYRAIIDAPTVERPKGKWIKVDVRNCHATLKCSVCDRVIEPSFNFGEYSYEDIKTFYPYCHCGADMR